LLVIL